MSGILQISDHCKNGKDLEGVADLEHLENQVHPGMLLNLSTLSILTTLRAMRILRIVGILRVCYGVVPQLD